MSRLSFYIVFIIFFCVISSFALAEELFLDLNMPSQSVSPGMTCGLDLQIINYGDSMSDTKLYIALNAGTEEYWFYPGWVKYPEDVSWLELDIPRGGERTIEIIPEFSWPEGIDTYETITFWAVVVGPLGLTSNLESIEFEYVEHPEIRSLSPANGSPGTILTINGSGFDPTKQTIQVQISSYKFNPLASGVHSDGSVTVCSVIPPFEPGLYSVRLVINDKVTKPAMLTIKEFQSNKIPPKKSLDEFKSGFTNLCSIFEQNIIPNAVTLKLIAQEDQQAFLNTVHRSLTIFNGFTDLFESLKEEDQDFLSSLFLNSNLYAVLNEIESTSSFGQDMTSTELLLSLDTASAVFETLEICFTALEMSVFVHLDNVSATEVQIAALVTGCHISFSMLDHLIDGFFTTELSNLRFGDLGSTDPLFLPIEESVDFLAKGIFETQDVPNSDSFSETIESHLSPYSGWFDEYRDHVFFTTGDTLENLGYELTASYLGDELLGIGSQLAQEHPLVINRFNSPFDLTNDLNNTFFNHSQNLLTELIRSLSPFSCQTGVKATCSTCDNCLETIIDRDLFSFRSLDCSTDSRELSLWFFWYNYSSGKRISNLEFPTPQAIQLNYETKCDVPKGFSYIPPGKFQMGTPESEKCRHDNEGPVHDVTLTKGFFMKHTEVTQNLWNQFMEWNPSEFESDNRPVELAPWGWVCVFCNRYSISQGLVPCYYADETFTTIYDTEHCFSEVYWDQAANGYRLPTEAEWEYSCRAGSTGPYYNAKPNLSCMGHDKNLSPLAWYWDNATFYTMPVALKQPNKWKLYDMLGNVREMCWDRYQTHYYQTSPNVDPVGPDVGGGRVVRGGSYYDWTDYVRCGRRHSVGEDCIATQVGFRVVRSLN